MPSNKKILVTTPLMPDFDNFTESLKKVWESRWLTNNGLMHQKLEKELQKYLGVPFISLYSNGTLALLAAIQALQLKGEVITTPYSFVATSHALWWHNCTPVFVDIDKKTCNIDVSKIEEAITEKTSAIMPVHVYGNPCNDEVIKDIAARHNLKVIYDAAHAFNVKKDNYSILNYGDLSVLSFHATKTYSTVEGGAVICHTEAMKHHLDNLKNFGFRGETVIEEPGINAKMNEIQATYGLATLPLVEQAIENRKEVAHIYRRGLSKVSGLTMLEEEDGVSYNYSYFPVFIDENIFGMSRDKLYEKLKNENIFGRRYFYPLISNFAPYKNLSSANEKNLKVANEVAESVICLPMHHDLNKQDVERIIKSITDKQ